MEATMVGLSPFEEDESFGKVQVIKGLSEAVTDGVCYFGYATGLEPNVVSFLEDKTSTQCNVKNGCGAHIHSGSSCDDVETQGGHYYDTDLPVDPWLLESYYSTDAYGTAFLIGCTITGEYTTDYTTHPFIVHGTDGGRVMCGLLGDENPF